MSVFTCICWLMTVSLVPQLLCVLKEYADCTEVTSVADTTTADETGHIESNPSDFSAQLRWDCVCRLLHRSHSEYDDAVKCYKQALKRMNDNQQVLRDLAGLQVRNTSACISQTLLLLDMMQQDTAWDRFEMGPNPQIRSVLHAGLNLDHIAYLCFEVHGSWTHVS
jgi:hypothetical protein